MKMETSTLLEVFLFHFADTTGRLGFDLLLERPTKLNHILQEWV